MTIRERSRLAARASRFAIGVGAVVVAAAVGMAGTAFAQPVDVPATRPMTIEMPPIDFEMVARQLDMAATKLAKVPTITSMAVAVPPIDLEMVASQLDMASTRLAEMTIEVPSMAFAQDSEKAAREKARQDRDKEAEQRGKERETHAWEQARQYLDDMKYDRAIERFNDVIAMKGPHADAALYWKAWAQSKAGQGADALATIATLRRDYSKSTYVVQANAVEQEVRLRGGQAPKPENQQDEDLKLMAIQALQNSDPEQAVPMLEKLLQGTASPRVKSRALFVLAQSDSPRAREVMKNIAKGNSTPELQNRAIDYLGTQGGRESRATLAEIYASSSDVDVKRRILRAFMVAGEKDRLMTAAQSEKNPELRAEAVQQLGVMGAHDELWQLYQKETAVDVKKRIIQAMFVGGNSSRLIDLAKTEKDPELRRTAVRNLGIMGSKETGAALVEIYNTDKAPDIRKAVVMGLFQQNNATALIDLARKEQDVEMKKEIVSKLSLMGNDNPEVMKYMLELLNK